MEKVIPLSVPNLSGKELEYVTNAIEAEWVSTAGAYITEFEQKIAKYVGVEEAVACQSGTAGLHLALKVCGVGEGDEVIVPTLTFIAAVNPIKYLGADPVFMDCDDNLTIDVDKLNNFLEKECIYYNNRLINKKTRKEIKAVIAVHIFGNMVDMENLKSLTDKYKLKLIEDATEALGSFYLNGNLEGKHAGTIGDVGVYSFNGNKIITTGGGGMIVSNNKNYLDKCRYLSMQAKDDAVYFIHNDIGYNYRMTNIQAAIGMAQYEQLEKFISIKKKNYDEYKKRGIELLSFRSNIRPNYWFYSISTDERDKMIQYLAENKIQTRPIWKLINTLKPYNYAQTYKIEKATKFYDKVVNLPCSSNLTIEEIKYIAFNIKNFMIV